MRYIIFGDESTIPSMVDILGAAIQLIVVASNRPRSFEQLSGDDKISELLYIQPPKKSDRFQAFLETIKACNPDYYFCFSYSMILSRELLAIPQFGAINFHGGLLPEFRGANIYNWALIEDAQEIGMTAHFMTPGIDDGDIILQQRIPILEEDTAKTLKTKVDPIGFELLNTIKMLLDTNQALPRTKQDETKSRYFRRRRPENGLIDWSKSDREIFNLIRALVAPWPGAFFFDRQGEKVVLDRYHTLAEIKQLRQTYGF